MSLLLQSVVGASATDLDGVLSAPLDARREERGFHSGLGGVRFKDAGSDEASTESSSIGAPDDSDEEETGSGDDDEVQSTLSLDALEDSLPVKKGLSGYYAGRSKSFGNLSDVRSVNDVQKTENPFNKRRRNILAHKLTSWSTSSCSKRRMMMNDNRSSFYGHRNPISMPLLPLHEHDDDDEEDEDGDDEYKDDMDNRGGSTSGIRRSGSHLDLNAGSRLCI